MTAIEKIARRKPSLLELASELSNVSKACEVMGYSRQQFYEIRRNFQTCGTGSRPADAFREMGCIVDDVDLGWDRGTLDCWIVSGLFLAEGVCLMSYGWVHCARKGFVTTD